MRRRFAVLHSCCHVRQMTVMTVMHDGMCQGTLNLEKFIQINLERTGMRKMKARCLNVQAVEGKKVLAE